MSTKPVSVPWILRMFGDEILTLVLCVGLDVIEYLFPPLMMPVAGDLVDILGITVSVYFFNWIGAITFLELIPGLDSLPIFTAAWFIWYYSKRRHAMQRQAEALEEWR